MLRFICLALLFCCSCRKNYSNSSNNTPEPIKALVRSDTNCTCGLYASSLDYKGTTYYTLGAAGNGRVICDLILAYYDASGMMVSDPQLTNDIHDKAKNLKKIYSCGDD